ncbi:glycosyltransferase family 4 protein [Tardisphaera miroshnichenkoae]
MKILILGGLNFLGKSSGGAKTRPAMANSLSRRHEVIYMPYGKPEGEVRLNANFRVITSKKELDRARSNILYSAGAGGFLTEFVSRTYATFLIDLLANSYDLGTVSEAAKKEKPDLIIHEGPDSTNLVKLERLTGAPVIERFHWVSTPRLIWNFKQWEAYGRTRYDNLLASTISQVIKGTFDAMQMNIARQASTVIALSYADRAILEGWGIRNVDVTFPPFFNPKEPPSTENGKENVVLVPGAYAVVNKVLIDYVIWLAEKVNEAKFVITGVKAPIPAPDNVKMGYFTEDEMRSLYTTAKVVLVPVLMATGLQTKVAEALSRGKAIVTTSLAAEEYRGLKSYENAIVEDDPERVVDVLKTLLTDDELRKKIKRNALSYVEKSTMNQERHISAMEKLLAESIGASPQRQSQ